MQITNLSVDEVNCFENSSVQGIILSWSASIGFGELTIYKNNSDEHWHADTECMCNKDDKEFIYMVLNKWVEEVEVNN